MWEYWFGEENAYVVESLSLSCSRQDCWKLISLERVNGRLASDGANLILGMKTVVHIGMSAWMVCT